jgi:hypothetical protein
MTADFDSAGFNGVWRMYLPDSKVRDPETGEWVPEVIRNQVIELQIHDGVMDYRVRIDHAEDLSMYMRYTCRFDDPEWVPYSLVHIEGDPNHESLRPNDFRKVPARVGEPVAYLKHIYVDPRTHYRITKHPDGTPQYVMLRRLSEDSQRYVSTVWPVEGNTGVEKHFIRDPDTEVDWPQP